MRTPIIAGNWKMNGTMDMAKSLCGELVERIGTAGAAADNIDIVLCPPAILLRPVTGAVSDSQIHTGSQDIDQNEAGAYTGQTAASMVVECGAEYCLIGHSERRTLFGESDRIVAEKTATALAAGLIPVVCVGETRAEREDGETETVVGRQLAAVVDHCGIAAFASAVVAYEPVWAIGTGLTATPEQAQQIHAFIRQQLAANDSEIADGCRILYGGSMKPDNASELLSQIDIDGGLIGGASLNSKDFFAICAAAIEQTA